MQDKIRNNFDLLKSISPFLSPFRKETSIVIALIPVIAFFQGVQPFLLKEALDRNNLEKNFFDNLNAAFNINLPSNTIWLYPLLLGLSLFFLLVVRVLQNSLVQRVGQKFVFDIREKLFIHLQSLSIEFFEKNQVGKLLTRLTSDIESLSETFSSGLIGGLNDVISLIGIAIFMFFIDWRLTIAQLTLIPILLLLTQVFEKIYRDANSDSRKALAQLNSSFQESLWGLQIIKLFGGESYLFSKFNKTNNEYIRANNKYIFADSAFSACIELIGLFGILLVLLITVLFSSEKTSLGSMVAFVGYSQQLFGPIRSLSEKFSTFQAGFTSAERIVSLLEQKPSLITTIDMSNNLTGSYQSLNNDSSELAVKFDKVFFKYDISSSDYILSDISIDLPRGKTLGIVGKTGSGKSTLIKLLCRFYDVTEGSISINGKSIKNINPAELRKKVLMIPQRSFLFSGSIKDNLLLNKTDFPIHKLEDIANQTGLIEVIKQAKNGFDTDLREGGVDLSIGQKQLISLTRSLIQDADILILDEATASLDTHTEALVTNAIKHIIRSGKTLIFIAHRINLVAECDQILVLDKGQIIESGTHEELLSNKHSQYSYLVELSNLV